MNTQFNIDNMNLTLRKHNHNHVIREYDRLLKSFYDNSYN